MSEPSLGPRRVEVQAIARRVAAALMWRRRRSAPTPRVLRVEANSTLSRRCAHIRAEPAPRPMATKAADFRAVNGCVHIGAKFENVPLIRKW